MKQYLLLMHQDAIDPAAADDADAWGRYLAALRSSGQFDGGSAIGAGETLRKGHAAREATTPISGFLRIRAADLDGAKGFLAGNPAYEAGATVEIRTLPED